jgi:cytochrome c biogenesis factor
VTLTAAVVAAVVVFDAGPGTILLGTASATVILVGMTLVTQRPKRRRLVATVAHLGVAVFLMGVAGSSFGTDFSGSLRPGDEVEVGGHIVVLESVETGETDRYLFVRAHVTVDGTPLTPEIRAYEDQPLPVAEPALRSTLVDDVVVAVSLLFPDGETVAVSVFVRPLVWLVWLGALLTALAGLIALFGSAGAGARPRRAATTEPQPGEATSDSASR